MQFRPPFQPGEPEWKEQQPSMYTPIPPAYIQPETYQQLPQRPAQPPSLPVRKELRNANFYLIIGIVSVVIIIGAGLWYRSYTDMGQSTSSPASGTWTTTHTFSGNGIKQTEIFTVSNDWQLQWTCDPSSFMGNEYYVGVYIYNSDGTVAGVAVNTICKVGNTGDSTELHQGGSIYLEVNSSAAWTLTIQEVQ